MLLTVSKYEVLESFEYCWKFCFYKEELARVALNTLKIDSHGK